ncbi:MAG: DUF6351 family protein, partial [Pseudohongiellaceae bacterium]
QHRQYIEGMGEPVPAARDITWQISFSQIRAGIWPTPVQGSTQCLEAWNTLSSLVNNPRQGRLQDLVAETLLEEVDWSYWEDLVAIYGRDAIGYANSLWDNDGVQYGLLALREKQLSIVQFLELNRLLGSWVPQADMQAEKISYLPGTDSPIWLSIFSRHNISQPQADPKGKSLAVAARYQADLTAVQRAYQYGQLFVGYADIPVLDIRHYLDPVLDMHQLQASFVARQRILQRQGDYGLQRIWVSHPEYNPESQAIAVMRNWITQQQEPVAASDRCFAADGTVLVAGEEVWQPGQPCAEYYPFHENSRTNAGASLHGLNFICEKQSVTNAISRGLYSPVDMTPYQAELEQIFPNGVCDYQKPDAAMPVYLQPYFDSSGSRQPTEPSNQ